MEHLTENWMEILLALHVIALAIVNLTPTPKDNKWLSKIYPMFHIGAGMLTKKSKDGNNV